jgi:cobalt-zinc-cadmium efflux system protein
MPSTLARVDLDRVDELARADRRRLAGCLALVSAFMAGEVAAGLAGRSLALLADAAHMLTDAAALVLALVAAHLATRPPGGRLTFGLKRAEILSALANGVALVLLAGLVAYEGARRLQQPQRASGWTMLGVALAGVAVNLAATALLAGGRRASLNVRGALWHLVGDLAAFAATAAAAVAILATGFDRADAIASLAVSALMVGTGWRLVVEASRVLLEAAPAGLSVPELGSALASQAGVVEVHDLHVWEITSGFPALSAHVLVEGNHDCHAVRRSLEELLRQRFGIDHTTLQVDHADTGTSVSLGPTRGAGEASA